MSVFDIFAAKLHNGGTVDIPTTDANTVLSGVLDVVYVAAGVTCVVVIIIAGIMYSTSEGDPGKTASAKNAITYAIVGLVLIFMAFIITGFITRRFQ